MVPSMLGNVSCSSTPFCESGEGGFGNGDLDHTPLFTMPVGRGLVIASQFLVTDKAVEHPAALRLFANLLTHADRWKPGAGETVIEAGAADPRGLVKQARKGATVLVGPLDSDGLAAWGKVTGIDFVPVPVEEGYQAIRVSDDPLTAGISNEDTCGVESWTYSGSKENLVVCRLAIRPAVGQSGLPSRGRSVDRRSHAGPGDRVERVTGLAARAAGSGGPGGARRVPGRLCLFTRAHAVHAVAAARHVDLSPLNGGMLHAALRRRALALLCDHEPGGAPEPGDESGRAQSRGPDVLRSDGAGKVELWVNGKPAGAAKIPGTLTDLALEQGNNHLLLHWTGGAGKIGLGFRNIMRQMETEFGFA